MHFKKLSESRFSKIYIITTRRCNLRCRYCYLRVRNALAYPSLRAYDAQMNYVEKFVDFIENCIARGSIRKVVEVIFFGGEPTLNIEPILYVTKKLNRFMEQKRQGPKISFNISTNGVLCDPELVDIFSKYRMNVVLSLDGPPNIHNYHRPKIDGQPSFNDVVNTLEELLRLHKQKRIHLSIQATISKHTLKKLSLIDLAKWFINTYGVVDLSFYPVSTSASTAYLKPSNDKMICAWKEFFDYLFDGAVNNGEFPLIEYRTLSTMLRLILICAGKLKPSSICLAGLEVLSLSVNGDLCACGTASLDWLTSLSFLPMMMSGNITARFMRNN
ncbi:MAG: radical SAM protein [Candidatus Bathyarchaeia archaeon]